MLNAFCDRGVGGTDGREMLNAFCDRGVGGTDGRRSRAKLLFRLIHPVQQLSLERVVLHQSAMQVRVPPNLAHELLHLVLLAHQVLARGHEVPHEPRGLDRLPDPRNHARRVQRRALQGRGLLLRHLLYLLPLVGRELHPHKVRHRVNSLVEELDAHRPDFGHQGVRLVRPPRLGSSELRGVGAPPPRPPAGAAASAF